MNTRTTTTKPDPFAGLKWGRRPASVVAKAIDDSIAHWRRLAAGKPRGGEDHFVDSCALCTLHYRGSYRGSSCGSCPVRRITGFPHCKGTPWAEIDAARDKELDRSLTKNGLEFGAVRFFAAGEGYGHRLVMDASRRMLNCLLRVRREWRKLVLKPKTPKR